MKAIAVALLATCLAGCQTIAPTPGAGGTAVSQVQQYARTACAVIPTAQTINALLVRNTTATSYLELAQQICNAIQFNPMTEGVRGGRTQPRLNGVVIRYRVAR